MKKETKKFIRNGIFFFIIVILTYIVIFSKINIKQILAALKESRLIFILTAFVLASNNITFEAINLKRNLKLLNDDVSFFKCMKYAIIGFFFSSITPASSGGQPMQLYSMTKDKIEFSHGASALFTHYIFYMISAVFMAIIGFILNYTYINEITYFKYLIYIGIFANSFLIAVVLIAMFSKNLSHIILDFIISIVGKVSPQKAIIFKKDWGHQLNEYHKKAKFITKHKFATFKTFIISLLQVISIHSVSYFIFYALGYNDYSYIKLLMLQSVIFISVSALPLPGTVGVSETGFALMYKLLFPLTIVEASMILSRGISFYFLVVITGLILLIMSIINKVKKKRK